jgi:hypothetical protein
MIEESEKVTLETLANKYGLYHAADRAGSDLHATTPDERTGAPATDVRTNARRIIRKLTSHSGDPDVPLADEAYDKLAISARKEAAADAAKYFRPNRDALVRLLPAKSLEKKVLGITPVKMKSGQLEQTATHNRAVKLHKSWLEIYNFNRSYQAKQISDSDYSIGIAEIVSEAVADEMKKGGYSKELREIAASAARMVIRSHEAHAQYEGARLQQEREKKFRKYFKRLKEDNKTQPYTLVDYARNNLLYAKIKNDEDALNLARTVVGLIPEPKKKGKGKKGKK